MCRKNAQGVVSWNLRIGSPVNLSCSCSASILLFPTSETLTMLFSGTRLTSYSQMAICDISQLICVSFRKQRNWCGAEWTIDVEVRCCFYEVCGYFDVLGQILLSFLPLWVCSLKCSCCLEVRLAERSISWKYIITAQQPSKN